MKRHIPGLHSTQPADAPIEGLFLVRPVVERALERAALMLGSNKSRGYMLEMICADFVAGASVESKDTDALMQSLDRLFGMLSKAKQQEFLATAGAVE